MRPDISSLPPTPAPARRGSWIEWLLAVLVGGLLGFLCGFGGRIVEHHGPTIGPLAFNGNGSLVVPFCLGPILLLGGLVFLLVRRAYVAAALYAIAFVVVLMTSSNPTLITAP